MLYYVLHVEAMQSRGLTFTLYVTAVELFPVMQEGLYEEDMNLKVKATGMIAQLFRNTENFEVSRNYSEWQVRQGLTTHHLRRHTRWL